MSPRRTFWSFVVTTDSGVTQTLWFDGATEAEARRSAIAWLHERGRQLVGWSAGALTQLEAARAASAGAGD